MAERITGEGADGSSSQEHEGGKDGKDTAAVREEWNGHGIVGVVEVVDVGAVVAGGDVVAGAGVVVVEVDVSCGGGVWPGAASPEAGASDGAG